MADSGEAARAGGARHWLASGLAAGQTAGNGAVARVIRRDPRTEY